MIIKLDIQNLCFVKSAVFVFDKGLNIVSGETGSGKSITLECLSFALGNRVNRLFLTSSQAMGKACVSCKVPSSHAVWGLLAEHKIDHEPQALVLERILRPNGTSKGFVNQKNIPISLLKRIGDSLVALQGQGDVFFQTIHPIGLIDAYGQLEEEVSQLQRLYANWKEKESAWHHIQTKHKKTSPHLLYDHLLELRHLNPQKGQEAALLAEQKNALNQEKRFHIFQEIAQHLEQDNAFSRHLSSLHRVCEKLKPLWDHPIVTSLETGIGHLFTEYQELCLLWEQTLTNEHIVSPQDLEGLTNTLHALRDVARKHKITCDDLPEKYLELEAQAHAIECMEADEKKALLQKEHAVATYHAFSQTVHQKRLQSAHQLAADVKNELTSLNLPYGVFTTHCEEKNQQMWSAEGIYTFCFHGTTNPDQPPAPLADIASGGEKSRFFLAFHVALAKKLLVNSLVFDEIDYGTSGATAQAIALRLSTLSSVSQVIVLTHSPQVMAQGTHHWKIEKKVHNGLTHIESTKLSTNQHIEEIARVLSGSHVTPQALEAAKSLKKSP